MKKKAGETYWREGNYRSGPLEGRENRPGKFQQE